MEQSVIQSPGALPAAVVVGKTPSLREPQLLDGVLHWLEQRPHEKGRTTLVRRANPDQAPEELTPGEWNLRSRVHDYGGGACALGHRADGQAVAVFCHDADRSLWLLDLEGRDPQPRRLSPAGVLRRWADRSQPRPLDRRAGNRRSRSAGGHSARGR